MMLLILEHRRKTLGKEQPYTLLAICNLGQVKLAMGNHEDAARIMRKAILIAERNLGKVHFGVLAGKTHYAQVLVHQKRYKEAEEILYAVSEKSQYPKVADKDGEHPDPIVALWYLTGCLEREGKFQEVLEICEVSLGALQEIGGQRRGTKHKFATMLQDEKTKLEGLIQGNMQTAHADLNVPREV
jgi:tetratricopeptide (TPR) repeat protein